MNYTNNFINPYEEFIIIETTLLSAKTFNILGSQYLAGLYLLTHHNHNDIYYLKSEMDIRYFSDTFTTDSDADKIDGEHLSDILDDTLPIQSILLWESSIMPDGWVLCNGQTINGITTIDMRDYFVAIAGGNYVVNQTFGSNLFSLSVDEINISNHILTIDEMPVHHHTFQETFMGTLQQATVGYASNYFTSNVLSNTKYTLYVGLVLNSHNHNTNSYYTVNNNLVDADNRPLHHSLYFIEKVV